MIFFPWMASNTTTFKTFDGLNLNLNHIPPIKPDKNTQKALVIHGVLEHSGRYQGLAAAFSELEWIIPDLRGHGKSDGPRGVVSSFNDLLRDAADLINAHQPVIVVGHSMGGLIVARLLQEQRIFPNKVILSAPALALEPLALDLLVQGLGTSRLQAISKIRFSFPWRYDCSMLTSDPDEQALIEKDALLSRRVGVSTLATLAAESLIARKAPWPTEWSSPEKCRVILAGADPIIRTATLKEYFPSEIQKLYPDNKHESFHEKNRFEVFSDVRKFLFS